MIRKERGRVRVRVKVKVKVIIKYYPPKGVVESGQRERAKAWWEREAARISEIGSENAWVYLKQSN